MLEAAGIARSVVETVLETAVVETDGRKDGWDDVLGLVGKRGGEGEERERKGREGGEGEGRRIEEEGEGGMSTGMGVYVCMYFAPW